MSGYTLDLTLSNRRCPATFPCGNMLGCGVSTLGCGAAGWSAKPIGSQSQTGPVTQSARGADRLFLRKGFGTNKWLYAAAPTFCANRSDTASAATCRAAGSNLQRQTPFRVAFIAGDPFGTINEAPRPEFPAPNQVARSGISYGVLPRSNGGGLHTGSAGYTGNPKWVYDSSDYSRFRKLKAMSKNYNDSSFGGDQHNASQVAISAARRGFSR